MLFKKVFIVAAAIVTFGVNAGLKAEDVNPAVTIVWDNPEEYRDVDAVNGTKKRHLARVQDNFEKYFHKELPKLIEADQKIKLTIYDVDLAGDVRPMLNHSQDVRLVTAMYPPMMDIEYVISDTDGHIIKTARKRLRDITFNMSSRIGHTSTPFSYEKTMLKKWLGKELN